MNQMRQRPKRMMLFCEPCGYKQILESNEFPKDLPEIKTCPVQTNIPVLDPKTNKTINVPTLDPKSNEVINKAARPQPKKYKCPKCGRGVRLKELLKPYAMALDKVDEEKEQQRLEADKKKRLADGLPDKKPDANFLG